MGTSSPVYSNDDLSFYFRLNQELQARDAFKPGVFGNKMFDLESKDVTCFGFVEVVTLLFKKTLKEPNLREFIEEVTRSYKI